MKKYSIMMIDPPWNQSKGGKKKSRPNSSGTALDYSTMSTENVFRLLDQKIFTLAENTHTVFLWTIEKYLIESELEMLKRGYKRHVRMIWDKNTGPCPSYTIRYVHEYLVWYYKPKLMKISENKRGIYKSVVKQQSTKHSKKPDIFYKIVKDMYPNCPKLDVFSRQKRNGWDQWGDQPYFYPKLVDEGFGIII